MRLLGAVLAGGVGRRFGGDKALAELGGRTLLSHVAARLTGGCEAVVLCGRTMEDMVSLPDRPAPGLGPLAGIAAALRHAAEGGFDAVLTAPCDTPRLPADLAARLAPAPAFVAGLPLVGLWSATLADPLDIWLADPANGRSVRGWALAAGARAVAGFEIANVNTASDLAVLRAAP